MVVVDGLTVRPCSRRMYQSTPIPARSAISSRRKPGVRRLRPFLASITSGASFARLDLRKSPNSFRLAVDLTGPKLSIKVFINPRIVPGLVGRFCMRQAMENEVNTGESCCLKGVWIKAQS